MLNRYFIIRVLLRLFVFILTLIWFVGIISPCLNSSYLHSIYPYLKLGYSTVCHQLQTRSFQCNDSYFLVCSRCTGIYLGVLFTSLVAIFIIMDVKISFRLLLIFSFPMLFDVIFYSIGLYSYNKIIAASTGMLFGSVVFLYILSAIEKSLYSKLKSYK